MKTIILKRHCIIIVTILFISKAFDVFSSCEILKSNDPMLIETEGLINENSKIRVLTDVDGSVLLPAHELDINEKDAVVSFNISGRKVIRNTQLHVRIKSYEYNKKLKLRFYINPDESKNPQSDVLKQGIFVCLDGINWDRWPFRKESGNWYFIEVFDQTDFQIALDAPYGKENLDRLINLTATDDNVRVRILGTGERTFPLFEYGEDDGEKPIHFIIAGECNYETAAQWAADEMIRYLHSNPEIVTSITKHHILRIVPKVSPYSFSNGNGRNFLSEDGKSDIYAAARWSDDLPPLEMMHLKNEVLGVKSPTSGPTHIDQKRLHYLFVLHSWKTQTDHSGGECVAVSHSGNTLIDSPDSIRYKWAQNIMNTMTQNFPRPVKNRVAKSWYPGIARDYFLDDFNMLTFRIEFTTVKQGVPEFKESGRAIIDNLNSLGEAFNWSYVYP